LELLQSFQDIVYWARAVKGDLKKVYYAMVALDMGNHTIGGSLIYTFFHRYIS